MATTTEDRRMESLEEIWVGDVMNPGVVSCPPDTSLSGVASLMRTERIHCVVVEAESDDDPTRWGLISDLDLVAAAGSRGLRAGAIAERPALTVSMHDSIARAAELMVYYRSAHLLVLDVSGEPVGVISTLDVAGIMAGAQQ